MFLINSAFVGKIFLYLSLVSSVYKVSTIKGQTIGSNQELSHKIIIPYVIRYIMKSRSKITSLVFKLHIPFIVRHSHVIKCEVFGNLSCLRSLPAAHVRSLTNPTLAVTKISRPTLVRWRHFKRKLQRVVEFRALNDASWLCQPFPVTEWSASVLVGLLTTVGTIPYLAVTLAHRTVR
jgi:hypothetical protein